MNIPIEPFKKSCWGNGDVSLPSCPICVAPASTAMPAGQNERECCRYWLIATPLKAVTPIESEFATAVRSPWSSIEKTAICASPLAL